MGNECSAECGVRKVAPKEKEPSKAPRTRRSPTKDPPVQLHINAMALHREAENWRQRYHPSQELGEGATATVLQAEAEKAEGKEASVFVFRCYSVNCEAPFGFTSTSGGRPVAVKRFRKPATRSFQLELQALKRVGVHPNIVRLLESYSGSEDVLVLEYCDSLTLYDLVLKRHKTKIQFGRLLTSRLTQQLLLALEHVTRCDIIHQDVKPENLMLYNLSIQEERVNLKLGDFGWAVMRDDLSMQNPDGAGSLWYAPPELNPPVEGVFCKPGAVLGKTDMWSAGVVIYVILVGHNPFHAASKLKDSKKVEEEVLRLVAKGAFDKKSPTWLALPREAREFLTKLLQPSPDLRPLPAVARQHAYVSEQARGPQVEVDDVSWAKRGGMQRLAWLAIARACAESDLQGELVEVAFASAWHATDSDKDPSSSLASEMYIFHLAEKLSMQPAVWLKDGRWNDICQLAFRYLDVDGDGFLGVKDLCKHIKEDNAPHVASSWVNFWGDQTSRGLSEEDFKQLLCDQPEDSAAGSPSSPVAANMNRP